MECIIDKIFLHVPVYTFNKIKMFLDRAKAINASD
jgi:hypothetical protein